MSLQNLLKIGQLHTHTPTREEIQRLLAAAERNHQDSRVESISGSARFDLAYKAVMQCAMVGLMANGYRPSTTLPGHHQTMIQSLGHALGVPAQTWVVLDQLRKKRNANDYSGDIVEPAAMQACIAHAGTLLKTVRAWLQANRPDLI